MKAQRLGKQLQIVNCGAGALGHAGNGGELREIASGLGHRNDPISEHAAPFASHGKDRDRDRSYTLRKLGIHLTLLCCLGAR
jgi:hypothetical protein